MSFGQSIQTCFHKYADFNGRATRSEFWWFFLFQILVIAIPASIGAIFMVFAFASTSDGGSANGGLLALGGTLIGLAFLASFALLVPRYAVGCRRLHDKGISGWLQLIELIPFGDIALIVLWALKGDNAANSYGEPVA